MRYDDAAKVVLVRAVEEELPHRIAPELLLEAHAAAGDPASGATWIRRRAAYLVDHALTAYRDLLIPAEVSLPGPWAYVATAVAIGLASNYLGPAGRIHVIFNPIVLLALWNVAAYAGMAIRWVSRARRGGQRAGEVPRDDVPVRAGPPPTPVVADGRSLLERLFFRRAYAWLLGKVATGVENAKDAERVVSRFAELSSPVLRPAFWLWLRRLLHLFAIGIAGGAIVGMYVRGLFFAYHVV